MADNGNQNGGERNGGGNGPTQKPPTDLENARLKREVLTLKQVIQSLQDRNMSEGPMGMQPGRDSRLSFGEPDFGGLGRGDLNDLDDLGSNPDDFPQIPPTGVYQPVEGCGNSMGLHHTNLAQGPGDVAEEPKQKSKLRTRLEGVGNEVAASPVKSLLSRVLDWRLLGLAVVPIVSHATYKLFAFPQRMSAGGIFSQYLSSAKSFGYAIAHPIKAATELEFAFGGKFWETMGKAWDFINPVSKFSGMEFPTWSAAGTIGSVIVGAVFTLSAILNRQSISRMCRRVAGAITALSLPSIASEISNNLQTRAQTVSNALDLTPGGVGALYIASLLFVASYVVTQSNPVSEWIKRKKEGHSGGNPAACQSQGDVPRNAPGQAVPLDTNGWSEGTERWVAQPAAQPAPSQPKERSKIGAAVAGVVGAVAGALMYLPNKAAEAWRSRFGGRRTQRRNGPAFAAETIPMPRRGGGLEQTNAADIVDAWANDEAAEEHSIDSLKSDMENAPNLKPEVWLPVFNSIIEAGLSAAWESEASTQFANEILDSQGIFDAVNSLLDVYVHSVNQAINGGNVGDVDTGLLRDVHEVLGKYAQVYQRRCQARGPSDKVGQLEAAILEVERRQGGNN